MTPPPNSMASFVPLSPSHRWLWHCWEFDLTISEIQAKQFSVAHSFVLDYIIE